MTYFYQLDKLHMTFCMIQMVQLYPTDIVGQTMSVNFIPA